MALCPKCSENFIEGRGAISRRDNKTEICPECGYKEAIEDFKKYSVPSKQIDRRTIEDLLDDFQIPINWEGYKLWVDIIQDYLQDETKGVGYYYEKLAKKYNKTAV